MCAGIVKHDWVIIDPKEPRSGGIVRPCDTQEPLVAQSVLEINEDQIYQLTRSSSNALGYVLGISAGR